MTERDFDEQLKDAHRFAVMLKDWVSRRGETDVSGITWHDVFMTVHLAQFELVPTAARLVWGPGPDSWDPSEWKSDEELLGEMLDGQAEAEEAAIEGFVDGIHKGFEARRRFDQMNALDGPLPDHLEKVVDELCSPKCLPRNPGTPGGEAARTFLRAELSELGLTPIGEDGFDQSITPIGGTNLLGMIEGHGDRFVLLAAHYDACMSPNPGADDNAAGVAIALEVARRLHNADLERSVIIALFDAEEPPYFLGPTMGSQWFVDHPTVSLDRLDMMICLDLVGHSLGPAGTPDAVANSIFVLGAEKSSGTGALVDALPERDGVVPRRVDNYVIPSMSDYDPFMRSGIPFLFYSCGRWEHYHAATDTPDRLDYDKMAALAEHLTDLTVSLANRTEVPTYDDEAVDDMATLASLNAVIGAFDQSDPLVAEAAGVVDVLQDHFADIGSLTDAHRAVIVQLIAGIEAALE